MKTAPPFPIENLVEISNRYAAAKRGRGRSEAAHELQEKQETLEMLEGLPARRKRFKRWAIMLGIVTGLLFIPLSMRIWDNLPPLKYLSVSAMVGLMTGYVIQLFQPGLANKKRLTRLHLRIAELQSDLDHPHRLKSEELIVANPVTCYIASVVTLATACNKLVIPQWGWYAEGRAHGARCAGVETERNLEMEIETMINGLTPHVDRANYMATMLRDFNDPTKYLQRLLKDSMAQQQIDELNRTIDPFKIKYSAENLGHLAMVLPVSRNDPYPLEIHALDELHVAAQDLSP